MFCRKGVVRSFAKFTEKHLCQGLLFIIKLQASSLGPATLLRRRLAQVFFCEFCKISKNTCFYRAPVAASNPLWRIPLLNYPLLCSLLVNEPLKISFHFLIFFSQYVDSGNRRYSLVFLLSFAYCESYGKILVMHL